MVEENVVLDSIDEIIDDIKNNENVINPYIIKIKVVGCSENKFIPYKDLKIINDDLVIGTIHYPLPLIEKVVIRGKPQKDFYLIVNGEKYEKSYKVSSAHFVNIFKPEYKKIFEQFYFHIS